MDDKRQIGQTRTMCRRVLADLAKGKNCVVVGPTQQWCQTYLKEMLIGMIPPDELLTVKMDEIRCFDYTRCILMSQDRAANGGLLGLGPEWSVFKDHAARV